ncbi:MAG: dienelactone hydrolase family protein, partial [Rubripirellula sp.]|nr:dienelactone hydrolase family protein [Rubripirellula sp.]
MNLAKILLFVTLLEGSLATGGEPDTLPPLRNGRAPQNFAEMWAGFDPRAEPLEVETLHQWESDDVMLRIVRFRIGIFKGEKATLAAVYGYPKQLAARGQQVPGLVQIHGGGQYADAKACLSNARRGYATVSIAWAGRISSPPYRVTPKEVKLFWDEKRDDPGYRLTTDWGAVDGYHAPGRNAGNQFPSAMPQRWTLDSIESPRNSGWFLCALAARRALTFLERQPEVDADRLGVYGHSMGGKLTVIAAVDPRVKAAAPSCGGISDRDSRSPLYRATLSDEVSLANVACPILFLSPANDFHGRIGDLPLAVHEISSREYRVTCSPHHSHQDTSEYEVATQLWFDQHLKGAFSFPQTPETDLVLRTQNSIPKIAVKPDQSKPVQKVDVFYTQQGKANERPEDRQNTMNRFWHHAKAIESDGIWTAELPIGSVDKPIWVYANVSYPLEAPVSAVGYYYGSYNADAMNLSSVMQTVSAKQLRAEGVQPTLRPTTLIEDFQGDWEKQWFSYRPSEWARSTHKIGDAKWQAPLGARLAVEVQTAEPNVLVVRIDDYAVALELSGGTQVQKLLLKPSEFRDVNDEPLPSWRGIRRLTFSPSETLRPKRGNQNQPRVVGKNWVGPAPVLHGLQWQVSYNFLDMPRGTNQQAK